MNENLILSSARKAILHRLSTLGRHFCSDDIDEMVSMTVERFYSRGAYDPSKSAVQTYVSRIASHVVYDFIVAYDKAKERFYRLDTYEYDGPEASEGIASRDIRFADDRWADANLLDQEEEDALQQAKAKLSPRFRECYDLLAEGRSHAEIAGLLGTNPDNVALIAHRMRNQLKTLLNEVA